MKITNLGIDELEPNPWNPNKMTDEEFGQLVTEICRHGRVAKPIIVRRKGEAYEIVDGEHNWRAAKEVGLAEVPCEILEFDEFLARTETFKRNQHGRHEPVREGRMFLEMMGLRELSQRAFAQEINISEGSVRNSLMYVEAAEVRNGYACECRDAEISALKVSQVRMYMKLPAGIRDKWLDAGADPGLFEIALCESKRNPIEASNAISSVGLDWIVENASDRFAVSFIIALAFADCLADRRDVENIEAYVPALIDNKLPTEALESLPCRADGDKALPILSPEEWQSVIASTLAETPDSERQPRQIKARLDHAVAAKGFDANEVGGPDVVDVLHSLEDAPAFIREASSLTLDERSWLNSQVNDGPPDLVLEIKRRTCERVQELRSRSGKASPGQHEDSPLILEVFVECATEVISSADSELNEEGD